MNKLFQPKYFFAKKKESCIHNYNLLLSEIPKFSVFKLINPVYFVYI